jgi:hypothetical protein
VTISIGNGTFIFSFNDNYIAVGATGGYIFLLNSVTGQTGIPMKSIKVNKGKSSFYYRDLNTSRMYRAVVA